MTLFRCLPLLLLLVLISACGGSSSGSSNTPDDPPPDVEAPPPESDDLVDLVLAACMTGISNGMPEQITGKAFSERADSPEAFAPCFDSTR